MRLDRLARSLVAFAAAAPVALHAQGFGINEIGSCAIGRGQAVTGAPCSDPSVIYWNPAATVDLQGWSIYAGFAAIDVSGSFTSDSTAKETKATQPIAWVPNAFVNYTNKAGKWALGLGIYVPYGLTTEWPSDFAGAFEAFHTSISTIYAQPNFAWRFAKNWSVGAGPVLGYSTVELEQALDLSQQRAVPGTTFEQLGIARGTEFAQAKLTGSSTAFGFNVGMHGTIDADWQVGLRFLSQLTFDYNDADASFTQVPTGLHLAAGNPLQLPAGTSLDAFLAQLFIPGGPLSSQKVSTTIKHPAQLEIGVGYTGFTNTTISADFVFVDWSVFDQLPLIFKGPAAASSDTLLEDYNNSWSARIGVEHAFSQGWRGRAGFSWVHSPAPDITVTPLLPDQDRYNINLGVGVPLGSRYVLDAAYLYVGTSGRRGRTVDRSVNFNADATADELNSGFYSLHANIFSVNLKANF
ncbi:MAG TPA: outer membrane protein transport protein [Gemmatimonadaceae bacterium]|nr:outer membrane protein transport protein [Gemmatimonadaceae bacterium]